MTDEVKTPTPNANKSDKMRHKSRYRDPGKGDKKTSVNVNNAFKMEDSENAM